MIDVIIIIIIIIIIRIIIIIIRLFFIQRQFNNCQGYGKTTLTNFMQSLFKSEGKNCISMSIDDFYVTGAEQDIIAVKNADNPLLQFRGNGK